MNTATFTLRHPESGSRVFIEFALQKGTGVRIVGVAFAAGNVVSLMAVRERMAIAYDYLIKGGC